jgi:hypothetical protein
VTNHSRHDVGQAGLRRSAARGRRVPFDTINSCHIQDIQETKDEISEGCSSTVRSLARDDLPVLRQHLTIARQLLASGA